MNIINIFWNWYEKHLKINVSIAAFLFFWQLIHLIWLTGDVVLERLIGGNIITLNTFLETLIIIVDYTEIPALLLISLVYINELRKRFHYKSLLYLLFLNSQWLHIFWITDEFVIQYLAGSDIGFLPFWLAWLAIFIDYLELPVMYDTIKRAINYLGS